MAILQQNIQKWQWWNHSPQLSQCSATGAGEAGQNLYLKKKQKQAIQRACYSYRSMQDIFEILTAWIKKFWWKFSINKRTSYAACRGHSNTRFLNVYHKSSIRTKIIKTSSHLQICFLILLKVSIISIRFALILITLLLTAFSSL